MDAASEKLFSGPRLANEQNSNAAARCDLSREGNDIADGGTLSDYVRIPPLLRGLLRSGCNNYTVPCTRGELLPRAEL